MHFNILTALISCAYLIILPYCVSTKQKFDDNNYSKWKISPRFIIISSPHVNHINRIFYCIENMTFMYITPLWSDRKSFHEVLIEFGFAQASTIGVSMEAKMWLNEISTHYCIEHVNIIYLHQMWVYMIYLDSINNGELLRR